MATNDANFEVKMPPALVLCGGLGMRLRVAYDDGPKALAPVGGQPFLNYLLDWLRKQRVQRTVLCVGFRAAQIQSLYPEGTGDPVVHYSIESELLGTAGAIKNAESLIQADRFFVLNGDSLANVSLVDLLAFHCARGAMATIATVPMNVAGRFGSVLLDAESRVTGFAEKAANAAGVQQPVNAGVYVLERAVLDRIPRGRPVSFEREVFPALTGHGLYGFQTSGSLIDIGVPEDFQSAQTKIPERFAQ